MNKVNRYFNLAKQAAMKGEQRIRRAYRLGAVGIRSDGAIVSSNNLPIRDPERNAHAETRLTKKLNAGSEVFVVRIKRNGQLAKARPCKDCRTAMRMRGVKRCYYSISDIEYGVLYL